jgi:hypothetical protein
MLGLLLATEPAGAQSQLPPELNRVNSGTVTAHFGGETLDQPKLQIITQLWFTFVADDKAYPFHPREGELHFSDWKFEVFSPDGRYVLLPQDRFGPYHIVTKARLKEYLAGAGPDFVVSGLRPGRSEFPPAGVHHDAKWVSPQSIEFSFSCCGTEDIMKFDLERNRTECLRTHRATDSEQGPWKDC